MQPVCKKRDSKVERMAMDNESLRKLGNLAKAKFAAPLDASFRPAVLANRAYRELVKESGQGVKLVIGLERTDGTRSVYETQVFPAGHANAGMNNAYVERIVKFLLWQKGGWKVTIGGPAEVGEYIKKIYSPDGVRAFDVEFMGVTVSERPFEVVVTDAASVPPAKETSMPIGRHLEGCRIGFDLGASDRKVAAVIDGNPVFAEEIIWNPRDQKDPLYHYNEVMDAIKRAAAHMPRVDAIGGSSAGVIVNNRPMVGSLFRGVPRDLFNSKTKNVFLDIKKAWEVPLEVVNDGDVTALAGAMSLDDNAVLGMAMGSSEAVGYVNEEGNITGWLNELAFAPIDYNPDAPVDEWSGDLGCGVQYQTQQAVFRLAKASGIELDETVSLAERLKSVQNLLEAGDNTARKIWETIGTYVGYAVAHYADFYNIRQMLILGRVTSGSGGSIILERAMEVISGEFPELAAKMEMHLPDEKTRRVGQAVAAASLPAMK
jgi:predicted NBD/HSP70 family sugar kinase